ncbi:DUF1134 domain-containing protein [Stakelama tenebrarum]|uniref:DUF1134 domain-containing protein n=1 Tax=Stakelama tenebrarum TaxID=2711215 RepID=A0A6G6Y9E1_9SPHN|nr:DUF1134 domain-containing protein [Sphingosinithalassobacter tenebrarum]QIG81554.1 DUF1134 domain-containing protein [Sphingosinithalassobacter tenebrarum]
MASFYRIIIAAAAALAFSAAPAVAQDIQTIDPNSQIDADLYPPQDSNQNQQDGHADDPYDPYATPSPTPTQSSGGYVQPEYPASQGAQVPAEDSTTYKRDDLIGAAEGVFGQGAEGLAGIIEDILRDQGEPNGYIAGREASGAFIVGLRYGSGTLFHKVEGQRPVYWTGPSVGFDVGGDANKVFVLVYNLYDTQDLYKRFPGGEGRVYFVGGFSATYMRSGDVVLIPVRLGVGWRLGANVGYMKFTEKQRWLPF